VENIIAQYRESATERLSWQANAALSSQMIMLP
jgi:hypothetical protein